MTTAPKPPASNDPTTIGHGPPTPSASDIPLAVLEKVNVGYESTVALQDVTLEVCQGEFIGIVGPSGSGKTTLLRALLGQVRRFSGHLDLFPRPGRDEVRVGYVPQVDMVDWNFPITVEQVVMLGRWREIGWRPWSSRRDKQLMHELLDRLSIGHLAKRHIRKLSGGQQQRTFLARALIGDPDLLLLDEPTSGVDIKTRHEVMHLLGELNRAGTTIIMTTHDLNAVATHLPRLICVGEGQVVADGSPQDILTPEVLRRTYGAEMLVMRRGRAIYVVEHLGDASEAVGAEVELFLETSSGAAVDHAEAGGDGS